MSNIPSYTRPMPFLDVLALSIKELNDIAVELGEVRQRLDEALAKRQQCAWISVRHRLPPPSAQPILAFDRGDYAVLFYQQDSNGERYWWDEAAGKLWDPTHWQALPNPPEKLI